MDALFAHPAYTWLAFGALLIAFEAFTAPGLGIFIGGLGAISAGIIVESGLIAEDAVIWQFACFFGFTILWAAVSWKPLKKFRATNKAAKDTGGFSDVIGDSAIVGDKGLKRGDVGQVKWSGTLMNAELDDSAGVDSLAPGAKVTVKSVSGTTFKVVPK